MLPKDANGMENSVDPDETALQMQWQSDLGLDDLSRPICPKTWDHYDTYIKKHTRS